MIKIAQLLLKHIFTIDILAKYTDNILPGVILNTVKDRRTERDRKGQQQNYKKVEETTARDRRRPQL